MKAHTCSHMRGLVSITLLRSGLCAGVQAVPGKLSRYGLSQVINGLLDLGEQDVPNKSTS